MPENQEFAGMGEEAWVEAYVYGIEETATAMDEASVAASANRMDLGIRNLSVRYVYNWVSALDGLGIHINTSSQAWQALRTIIITNYSLLGLQGAWRTIIAAMAARETAQAASATAAMVAAQQYQNIILAASGATIVGTTLGGYAVGQHFGSGDWNFPARDINSPSDRRAMERDIAGVRDMRA